MTLLKEMIVNAGVVGAGGAGFPSAFKLADNIETILINAAECEPLLLSDFHILKNYRQKLEEGLDALLLKTNATRGVIAMKKHMADKLGIVSGAFSDKSEYKVMDDVYPAGDELMLIYNCLGKTVPSASIPISVGVVVYNIETLFNIVNAMDGKAVTRKIVTIGGDIHKSYVIDVPIGTKLSYILNQLGIVLSDEKVVIEGGPIMGKITDINTVVNKTTNGYIILPKISPAVENKTVKLNIQLNRASSACCGCRLCTDMCPRHLLGYDIEPHKIVKTVANNIANTKVFLGAFSCSSCGICETIACNQGISPKSVFVAVKSQLVKAGIKPQKNAVTPDEFIDYRKIPTSKLISRLGLSDFLREDYTFVKIQNPKQVYVNLRQHIGGVYPTSVKLGDRVKEGSPLVSLGKGLGAICHSSIDGEILEITECYVKVGEVK